MTLLLRPVLLSDLEAITGIYRESVENGVASYELTPPSHEEMTRRYQALTDSGYPYVVAEDEAGLLVGYAYAGAYRTRPAYRWTVEDSIYLSPSAQGRGVGKLLLGNLISQCTERGFRQMIAVIGGAHPASVRLHRAMGFGHCGTIRGTGYKHGRWLDTALMQLELGAGRSSAPEAGTLSPRGERRP